MKPFLEGNEDPVTVLLAREMEAISDADIVEWANRHAAPESYVHDPIIPSLCVSTDAIPTTVESPDNV